jgi:hypothetical protein
VQRVVCKRSTLLRHFCFWLPIVPFFQTKYFHVGNGERDPKVQLEQCDSLGICVRVANRPPFFTNQIFYEGLCCRSTYAQDMVLYYYFFLYFLQLLFLVVLQHSVTMLPSEESTPGRPEIRTRDPSCGHKDTTLLPS